MATPESNLPSDSEDLLWQTASRRRVAETREGTPVDLSDERLLAFSSGDLSPGERSAIEGALARNPEARSRLVELAGVTLDTPSAELREKILSFAPGTVASPAPAGAETAERTGGRILSWPATVRQSTQLAWLAAVLLAALGTMMLMRQPTLEPLPEGFTYRLVATGLTEIRSAEPTQSKLEALPQTMIRLTATPVGDTLADLEFGLYRQDGEILRKLPSAKLEWSFKRGTAEVRARASDLVGEVPGTYLLTIAVGRPGALPRDGSDIQELKGESARLLSQELILRRGPEPVIR